MEILLLMNHGVLSKTGSSILNGSVVELLATVFTGTSQVESDFSILRNEKDGFRNNHRPFARRSVALQANENAEPHCRFWS